ncbi:hypothetical protein MNB_SV-15-461 [hydrothermal vent metagenome]|uniref:Uncharacterized protein n=1 Tax=hydrothermal vent metagenome TaxID=652676 RepID=A0A1W1EJ43_9ZZZZ
MIQELKKQIIKMFREFLIYHNKSLEFRARIITLVIQVDNQNQDCKDRVLKAVAKATYPNDTRRANFLIDNVEENIDKILINNGLDYQHLIMRIEKQIKHNPKLIDKIDIPVLKLFKQCIEDEENLIYHDRVIRFLENIKEEYSDH